MPPALIACPACACHVVADACTCAHCGAKVRTCHRAGLAGVALLGLALAGCGDKDGESVAVDDTVDSGGGDDYGVPDTGSYDDDGDHYAEDEGDCDDDDPAVYPGATETPGDGVDQPGPEDCDGNDDT